MEILVTGGAGYIGSIVVEELLKQDYSVVVIDNLQEGNREAVLTEAVFYEEDFGNKKLLNGIFEKHKIDAVLHFAAETTIEFSMTDPAKYFKNNVVNGITLLEVMRKYGCNQFIFSSTAATFGEPQREQGRGGEKEKRRKGEREKRSKGEVIGDEGRGN